MSKGLYREFYLLPRGEQRGLILLSLLLILSLIFRIVVQLLPNQEPAGMEEFEQDARLFMAAIARADSLDRARMDSSRRKVNESPRRHPSTLYHTKSKITIYLPRLINRDISSQQRPIFNNPPGIDGPNARQWK